MRAGSTATLSLFAMVGLAVPHGQQFRAGIDVVTVNVTVTDRSGRFVSGLTQDDFTVFEDGQKRPIVYFEGEATPVSLGILLDASGSMAEAKFARLDLARGVVSRLVTHDLDASTEWMFARFTSAVIVAREWTADRDAVVQPLRETRATGDTSLYDAVALSIPLVKDGRFQKKALLVVSDGGETKSLVTLDDVRTEVVNDAAAIPSATARIADHLRHQYLLGYSTSGAKNGRSHEIRVDARGQRLLVRARRLIRVE